MEQSKIIDRLETYQSPALIIGSFQLPLPTAKTKYEMLIAGDMRIPVEVT